METKRLVMLFDALVTFYNTNYYGRGSNVCHDAKVLLNEDEVKEMVNFATQNAELDLAQKNQVIEFFLQYFNQAVAIVHEGSLNDGMLERLTDEFGKEITFYLEKVHRLLQL